MLKTITPKPKISLRQIITKLVAKNGDLFEIYECVHSGKIITREKIDTLTKVFHPGIIIGEDQYGRMWVAHNHYLNKRPMFDIIDNFSKEKDWLWDTRSVEYNLDEIVERTITEVRKGKRYNSLLYNCQTFVNLVVRNQHKSEAVDKISDGVMAFGGLLTLLGLIFKNKTLVYTGLGITGSGSAAKGISRIR